MSRPSASHRLAAARPVKGATLIAAELRRTILDGGWGHGERLPAERSLAALFGASRTTVRAGLCLLEAERLVERKAGAGTFVSIDAAGAGDDVAEITSPLELIEVRLAFEPQVSRLAVLNASARDIAAIARAMAALAAAGADVERFTEADQAFHASIAAATHNPLLIAFYAQIGRVRGHAQWSRVKDAVLTPAIIAQYNHQHREIVEAIANRDGERARRAMSAHLADARRHLMRV